jgi:hypothetical protein
MSCISCDVDSVPYAARSLLYNIRKGYEFFKTPNMTLQVPRCNGVTYPETTREFGLPEESDELRQLLALWRKRRGND